MLSYRIECGVSQDAPENRHLGVRRSRTYTTWKGQRYGGQDNASVDDSDTGRDALQGLVVLTLIWRSL